MTERTDEELTAALDRLAPQWTEMAPARIRALLQKDGAVLSEKRAKALKASRVVQSRTHQPTGGESSKEPAARHPAPCAVPQTPASCAGCGGPNASNTCSACSEVRYCSRDCQVAHWKVHKRTCTRKNVPQDPAVSAVSASASISPALIGKCPTCDCEWARCGCKDKPECWVCLLGVSGGDDLLRGCACRGSAGWVHAR